MWAEVRAETLVASTSTIYHEFREEVDETTPVRSEYLFYNGPHGALTSAKMPLFGCRKVGYGGNGPPYSPHGNRRAVLRANTILQSPGDYLLPLSEHLPGIGRLRQSQETPNNWYLVFVYLKASTIAKMKSTDDDPWVEQWRIENHPYLRLEGFQGNLGYPYKVNGCKTWCKILVPYPVQFNADIVWESVKDLKSWSGGRHIITERNTAEVGVHVGLLQ